MEIKLDDKTTAGIIIALIAFFSLIFLGFTGLRVIFGMLLVFFLPFYLILNNFDISQSEKIFFSFFIGLGIFPAIVYWLGVFISLKIAVIIAFVLLVLASFVIKKAKKTKTGNNTVNN